MSPRAASRLEAFGFTRVYDYSAGKADWGSFGLPLEGSSGSTTRVSAVALRDVPTCSLDELVVDVAGRVGDEWEVCVVVNDARIVQGLLDRKMLASGGMARAEDAMSLPPPTIRPSARRAAIAERMREQELVLLTVTHPDGVLVGVVRREDLE